VTVAKDRLLWYYSPLSSPEGDGARLRTGETYEWTIDPGVYDLLASNIDDIILDDEYGVTIGSGETYDWFVGW
jgi:hypothetical protein